MTEKRTQHNLFIRSGKSEAQVTTCTNRRLRLTNCTIETTDRHEASLRQQGYLLKRVNNNAHFYCVYATVF